MRCDMNECGRADVRLRRLTCKEEATQRDDAADGEEFYRLEKKKDADVTIKFFLYF